MIQISCLNFFSFLRNKPTQDRTKYILTQKQLRSLVLFGWQEKKIIFLFLDFFLLFNFLMLFN